VTVTWDEANQWLFADWHENTTVEFQISISMKNLELSKQYQNRKLLVNTTVINSAVDGAFQKWYTETWMPAAVNTGLEKVAFIVPSDFLTRFKFYTASLKQPTTTKDLHIQYFETQEAAEAWLAA
jgi:hypothetical protein